MYRRRLRSYSPHMMRSWLWLFSAMAVVVAPLRAADLDGLLKNPKLWTLTQEEFEKLPETKGFRWTSAAHDSARAGEQKLTVFGLPVVEVVARFDGGKLTGMTPLIF